MILFKVFKQKVVCILDNILIFLVQQWVILYNLTIKPILKVIILPVFQLINNVIVQINVFKEHAARSSITLTNTLTNNVLILIYFKLIIS
jgi:hypothetical protein